MLDALRAGPALFAGLPGDEVDLQRLAAHLATRRFDGGVYVTDSMREGVLWVRDGAADEAWLFEADGHEAILPPEDARELLQDIADHGAVSVLAGIPLLHETVALPAAEGVAPFVTPAPPLAQPPVGPPSPWSAAVPVVHSAVAAAPATIPVERARPDAPVTPHAPPIPAPIPDAPAAAMPQVSHVHEAPSVVEEPSTHPWPLILQDVAARVAKHRGPRVAALFAHALGRALGSVGGRLHDGRVEAPPMSDSLWRSIVEEACEPVVAIAGRAFTDRTIAAAERAILNVEGGTGA
jgi:hypothetical protein